MDLKYLDHLSDLLSIQGRLQHRPAELKRRGAAARGHRPRAHHPAGHCAGRRAHGNLDTKNSAACSRCWSAPTANWVRPRS